MYLTRPGVLLGSMSNTAQVMREHLQSVLGGARHILVKDGARARRGQLPRRARTTFVRAGDDTQPGLFAR